MNRWIKIADKLGMAGAVLCALHCIALPVLIMFIPILEWMGTGEETHQYLAAFAVLPVLAGLIPGYFMHRRSEIVIWGMTGLLCIFGAAWLVGPLFGEVAEVLLTIAGATALFTAHLKNRRHCLNCSVHAKLFFGN